MVRSRSQMPPNPLDIAADGIRTLRAFGQRIPGAGDVLARSLEDAVSGRTVMITGASSGIGKAAALEIGEAGGTMLLVARRKDQLQEVADEIEELGGVAYVHTCDLSNTDDIDRMCAEVLEQHQAVDVLVNNAGQVDPALGRPRIRPLPRLPADDAAQLLRRGQADPRPAADDARTRVGPHRQHLDDRAADEHAAIFERTSRRRRRSTRSAGRSRPEIINDGVHITTVYMPLVRTPMIAPTKIYDRFPTLQPEGGRAHHRRGDPQAPQADRDDAWHHRPAHVRGRSGRPGPGRQPRLPPDPRGRPEAAGPRADARGAGVRAGHPGRPLVGTETWVTVKPSLGFTDVPTQPSADRVGRLRPDRT